jgi:translation initiation factor 4G
MTSDKLIRRKTLNLLNKISPENCIVIYKQILLFILDDVKNENDIYIIVKTIFEKACQESTFSLLYAKLCDYIQNNTKNRFIIIENTTKSIKDNIELNNKTDMKTFFKKAIINLCQHSFHERNESKNTEETEIRDRKKMFGNIKFIGDLFKSKLIHESIIYYIFGNLLQNKDDNDNILNELKRNNGLEGCCRLLRTVGKQIDTLKSQRWIDQYFNYLKHYSKKCSESRIRFMILDIIELRENRWELSQETDSLKTKAEVQKEFKKEKKNKKY